MKWVVLIARVLVGLGFTATGVMHFAGIQPPGDKPPEVAVQFGTILATTHYMDVIKVCELVGGLLLLSGRLTPLGVVVAMPVAVNILLWDVLFLKSPMGPGLILVALLVVVMFGYRRHFLPFFVPDAKML